MALTTWLLPIALLIPAAWFAPRVIAAYAITRRRLGRLCVDIVASEMVPPGARHALGRQLAELKALGFTERQFWQRKDNAVLELESHAVEMSHADGSIRAIVDLEGGLWRGVVWQSVSFRTLLVDGREIETRDSTASPFVPRPQANESELLAGSGVARLLERHRERLAAVIPKGIGAIHLDAEAARAREQAMSDETWEQWRASGATIEGSDGRLRWKFRAAFRHAKTHRSAS